jgi:hypothetical protein
MGRFSTFVLFTIMIIGIMPAVCTGAEAPDSPLRHEIIRGSGYFVLANQDQDQMKTLAKTAGVDQTRVGPGSTLPNRFLPQIKRVFEIADEDDDRVLTADELFCYMVSPSKEKINTRKNVDILGLPITSPYMTAPGIQYYLRFQYLLRAGRDGRSLYPVKGKASDEAFIQRVMKNTNTGTLTRDLCEVNNAADLRAGDIITTVRKGYGHAVGVLVVMQIEGERYFKLFAGSYPASSVRVYPFLLNPVQLERLQKEGLLFFRRWCE